VFAASGDLGNFSGFVQGSPDYERPADLWGYARTCTQSPNISGRRTGLESV
jgi:hypothetical protein